MRDLKTQEDINDYIKLCLDSRLHPTLETTPLIYDPSTFKPTFGIKYRGTDKLVFRVKVIDVEAQKIVEENIKAIVENLKNK